MGVPDHRIIDDLEEVSTLCSQCTTFVTLRLRSLQNEPFGLSNRI